MMVWQSLCRMQSTVSKATIIKRLKHQSLKRGTSENGILLGAFAGRHLDEMDSARLKEYEEIISENDVDLFNWLSGVNPEPAIYLDSPTFQKLRAFFQERKRKGAM